MRVPARDVTATIADYDTFSTILSPNTFVYPLKNRKHPKVEPFDTCREFPPNWLLTQRPPPTSFNRLSLVMCIRFRRAEVDMP